ncbi:putative ankyrin repeat region domain-containing protein [Phytophthora infestans]|uniref:Putative ankyrin repeat region domain-containing protein n=1 Tax=Phytophthora infestans TaxID=4787 RepID=A0A833RXT3_PHYIN|nr:putative ankyrin repeat region domain-containing protein [Phytophthora infestans]
MSAAVRSRRSDIIRWQYRYYCTVRAVVAKGRFDDLQWLVHQEKIITFVPIAAQNGYLVIVRWVVELTQQKHTTSERVVVAVVMLAIHAAAFHGHLEVAKYLREIARCGEWTLLCREASSRQQTRGLHNRWLLSGGQMATSILNRRAAMDGAPLSGCLELVQWLHQYRTEGCTSKAMDNAAMNGRGEMASF